MSQNHKQISSKISSLFIILHFLLLINHVHCSIQIPIKYFPIFNQNEKSPNATMKNIVFQKIYAILELGTPKQQIHIPIIFDSNDFYIVDDPLFYLNNNTEIFSDFKIYNSNLSKTYSVLEESNTYYGVNFFLAYYSNDIFYFGDKKVKLDFYYSQYLENFVTGELGLQLLPNSDLNSASETIEKSFLKKLKNQNVIKDYIWGIFYDKKNDQDGYIFIGDFPHNDLNKEDKYSYDSLHSVDATVYQNNVQTIFDMDNLIIYQGNDENNIIKEIELDIDNFIKIEIDYNFGAIQAPISILKYLEENVFNLDNRCYKSSFKYRNKYIFFYCDNNSDLKNKLIKKMPTFKFTSKYLYNDFYIQPEHLFIERDNNIFCLLIFHEYHKKKWKLGIPFTKKYQFFINQDSKKIFYYSMKQEIKMGGMKSSSSILIIILLSAIFLILGFYIGRKFYYKKYSKKRSKVIEDNFLYVPEQEQNLDKFNYEHKH